MPFLVDGDNLLGTWGRKRSDPERRKLAMELGRFAAGERKRLWLVFDGTGVQAAPFGANVRFSGAGRTADDVILEMLREHENRRSWIVVTSDRSLADQSRWLEARVERCDLFRKRLQHVSATAEKPEREEDIEYWLQQFGESD